MGKKDPHAGRVECVVSLWSTDHGSGFLMAPDGRRGYVHRSECNGSELEVGQTVSATIHPDPYNPGKWLAMEVQPLTGQDDPDPSSWQEDPDPSASNYGHSRQEDSDTSAGNYG